MRCAGIATLPCGESWGARPPIGGHRPHRLALLLVLSAGCSGTVDGGGADGGADQDAGGGAPDADPGPDFDAVFDLDLLHEVDIQVDDQYLDQLENDRENRVPCTITYDGTVIANAGIRQKGGYGSSSNLDGKPGFSIKFNELVPGQTLFGLHKLLLNNAQEDASFLSEHIGYEVHRRAGRPATFTAHGIVSLNGFTYGLYVVKEAVAEDFLERNFGRPNDDGNVYEGFYHPEDQSLGDFVTHPEQLDLKDEIEEMRTRDDVEALAAAIADTPDEQFETAVGALLDLDSYLTSFALDALLGYWDSYAFFLNNYYLYHDPGSGRFIYIPHGMDQLRYDGFDPDSYPMGRLAQRVRDIASLDARYSSEQTRLLDQVWDVGALSARIDRAAATIHSTARSDDRTVADRASFDANVEAVRQSIAARKP